MTIIYFRQIFVVLQQDKLIPIIFEPDLPQPAEGRLLLNPLTTVFLMTWMTNLRRQGYWWTVLEEEAAKNRIELRPFQYYLLILKVKFWFALCFTLTFVNFLSSYLECGKTSVINRQQNMGSPHFRFCSPEKNRWLRSLVLSYKACADGPIICLVIFLDRPDHFSWPITDLVILYTV